MSPQKNVFKLIPAILFCVMATAVILPQTSRADTNAEPQAVRDVEAEVPP